MITYTKDNKDKARPYNPHTPCLPSNDYYIEQTVIYSSSYYSSTNYNKWSFQWCKSNFKHVY